MSKLPVFSRSSLVLLCILGATLLTSGFPQPLVQLSSQDDSEEVTQEEVRLPYFSLHDWGIKLMSAPGFKAAANSRARFIGGVWLPAPRSQRLEGAESRMDSGWPAVWSRQGSTLGKRNMVVADDAAFREKSKLLTAMERQKWLNSYMQKLLVVQN